MSKQRLLFITTGGTIASVRTQQGLKPVLTSDELLAHLPELKELCCPETLALCSIDSTDLGQEHWLMMARAIQENYALYDGFIICHGTDTLAYSAAALSYLIQNADKPIILTGAQQPISNEITDAKKNLRDSVVCAIDPGSRGVMVVFGGHVIAGTRAKKNKTISYDAFASVNFPDNEWSKKIKTVKGYAFSQPARIYAQNDSVLWVSDTHSSKRTLVKMLVHKGEIRE